MQSTTLSNFFPPLSGSIVKQTKDSKQELIGKHGKSCTHYYALLLVSCELFFTLQKKGSKLGFIVARHVKLPETHSKLGTQASL